MTNKNAERDLWKKSPVLPLGTLGGGCELSPVLMDITEEKSATRNGQRFFNINLQNRTDKNRILALIYTFENLDGKILLQNLQNISLGAKGSVLLEIPIKLEKEGLHYLRCKLKEGNKIVVEKTLKLKFISPIVLPYADKEISLNGQWQCKRASLDGNAKASWQLVNVPQEEKGKLFRENKNKRTIIWYRRLFSIPKLSQGERVKLCFEAVQYGGPIFVNKKLVGKHSMNPNCPEEFDITKYVRADLRNEIVVGVNDERSLYVKGIGIKKIDEAVKTGDIYKFRTQSHADNFVRKGIASYIYPRGHETYKMGIKKDVKILIHPDIYIKDVWCVTSVSRKNIKLEITLANEGGNEHLVKVENIIGDITEPKIKELKSKTVKIESHSEKVIKIEEPWQNPRLWWPHSPKLYHLATILSENGKTIYAKDTRFGFREISWKGKEIRLNGRICHLFGAHESLWYDLKSTYKYFKQLKYLNINTCRDFGAATSEVFDLADEMGIFMIDEGLTFSVWSYQGAKFWDNATDAYRRMMIRDRNHPSVIMWSTENEFLLNAPGINPYFDKVNAKKHLIRMGDFIKRFDPTRPMTHEGNEKNIGSLVGNEDILTPHYPGEAVLSEHLLPNYYYNLGNDMPKDKPLYVGEMNLGYLCWNSRTPDSAIIYNTDDELYDNFIALDPRARSFLMTVQSDAYRYNNIVGMSPNGLDAYRLPYKEWVRENAQWLKAVKECFKPICIRVKEYDKTFFENEEIQRTVTIYNDILEDSNLTIKWRASMNGKKIGNGERKIKIKAGEFDRFILDFSLPAVKERTKLQLQLLLYKGNKIVDKQNKDYSVFPKDIKPAVVNKKIALYDIVGKTKAILDKMNVDYTFMDKIENIGQYDIFIIGAYSLGDKIKENAIKIAEFVNKGGMVICLEQENYPFAWLPILLNIEKGYASTINYIRSPGHPLMQNCMENDLKFWYGDNIVAKANFKKPDLGSFRVIVDTAGAAGLKWTPLLEIPCGKGIYVLSQLDISEKFDKEPIAKEMLKNLIEYADKYESKNPACLLLINPSESLVLSMKRINAVYDIGKISHMQGILKSHDVVIIEGKIKIDGNAKDALKTYVKNGGVLIFHEIEPGGDWENILPVKINLNKINIAKSEMKRTHALVKNRKNADSLLWGLSNQEFYWIAPARPVRFSWWPYRLSSNIIKYACNPQGDAKILTTPGSIIKVPFGKGFFIVDQIRWDKEKTNRRRADRIISQILTNIGCDLNKKNYEIFIRGGVVKDIDREGKVIKKILVKHIPGKDMQGPFYPDKDGFFKDWLLFGPFANIGGRGDCRGLDIDFLKVIGGEKNISLRKGTKVTYSFPPGGNWKESPPKEMDITCKDYHYGEKSSIDFCKAFKPSTYVVGYAVCYVKSPKEMDCVVNIGSDDGNKVWINHNVVGRTKVFRGSSPDQDAYPAHLKKGWNIIMVKVEQDIGGWNFIFRLKDKDGNLIKNIEIWL